MTGITEAAVVTGLRLGGSNDARRGSTQVSKRLRFDFSMEVIMVRRNRFAGVTVLGARAGARSRDLGQCRPGRQQNPAGTTPTTGPAASSTLKANKPRSGQGHLLHAQHRQVEAAGLRRQLQGHVREDRRQAERSHRQSGLRRLHPRRPLVGAGARAGLRSGRPAAHASFRTIRPRIFPARMSRRKSR